MARQNRPAARLACQLLEDRCTPAVLSIVVDTPNDLFDPADGVTSLREALFDASLPGSFDSVEISFAPALVGATVRVTSVDGLTYFGYSGFEVTTSIPIVIIGSGQRITRIPTPQEPLPFRLFAVGGAADLELRDVELIGGQAVVGGAVYNEGTLTLTRTTVTGNVATGGFYPQIDRFDGFTAAYGGGVYNLTGTLQVVNSTITQNQALDVNDSLPGGGGGIANEDGFADIDYSTIADNSASEGSQVYNLAAFAPATVTINYSILSTTGSGMSGPALVSERIQSSASATGVGNLIRGATGFSGQVVSIADPLLGPLQDNGGPTRTRALPANSPAIDLGEQVSSVSTDQRGVARAGLGSATDLGAYEFELPSSLSGFVYVDEDDDGIRDPGEAPIPGVLVTLTNGTLTLTATTGADGSYRFTNLAPGTYVVTESQPAGFVDGKDTAGSLGGTATNDRIADIVLTAGADGVDYTFGERIPLPPPPAPIPVAPRLVAGAGQGGGPHVKVFDLSTGAELSSFLAFDPAFTGGVRVAQGDFNRDGVSDIVTAAGPGGGPHVRVFDGRTGGILLSFFAFDPAFTGGVYVASSDVTGDGIADLVVGAGLGGGPHVRVFDGSSATEILSFFAYDPAVDCGVTVACTGGQIITGTGFGHAPHVKVFDARTAAELSSFYAFDPESITGVNVAAGLTSQNLIVFAGKAFGGSDVRQFVDPPANGSEAFQPFGGLAGGVTLSASDLDSDLVPDYVVGAGGGGSPLVRVFDGATGTERLSLLAFDAGFLGGVFVSVDLQTPIFR